MSLNACLAKSTVVAALGGLLFGFDTAVISGTTAGLTPAYNLSPTLLGHTVSAALWGTVLGALLAGIPGDRLGRRDSLRIMAILYLISALGCAGAWNWTSLVAFRFIGGLGIGGSSVLSPMSLPKSRQPNGAAGWWDFFSSMSGSEFSSPISPTTSFPCSTSEPTSSAGSLGSPPSPQLSSFSCCLPFLAARAGW